MVGATPTVETDRVFEHGPFGKFVSVGAVRIFGLPTEQGDTVRHHDLLDAGCSIRGSCELFSTPSFPGAIAGALVHDAKPACESATVAPVLAGFALGDCIPIRHRWGTFEELVVQLEMPVRRVVRGCGGCEGEDGCQEA